MSKRGGGQVFAVGEYARHERGYLIEGDIVSIDHESGKVRIFDMLAEPGSRGLYTVASSECIRVPKGNYKPYSK